MWSIGYVGLCVFGWNIDLLYEWNNYCNFSRSFINVHLWTKNAIGCYELLKPLNWCWFVLFPLNRDITTTFPSFVFHSQVDDTWSPIHESWLVFVNNCISISKWYRPLVCRKGPNRKSSLCNVCYYGWWVWSFMPKN